MTIVMKDTSDLMKHTFTVSDRGPELSVQSYSDEAFAFTADANAPS